MFHTDKTTDNNWHAFGGTGRNDYMWLKYNGDIITLFSINTF